MTRIDFYILAAGGPQQALLFSCRLAEKAWRSGHRVLLHCADQAEAQQLDKLLWQHRADSFTPHSLDARSDEAIAICHSTDSIAALGEHCDVLINTSEDLPKEFSRFQRLAEVVNPQEDSLQASRQRYSYYKRRGYPLHSHPLSS